LEYDSWKSSRENFSLPISINAACCCVTCFTGGFVLQDTIIMDVKTARSKRD
jgi:hypothetical protein